MVERSERRQKKTNQQYTRRVRYKRKRSLVSLLSSSSISSTISDRSFTFDEKFNEPKPNAPSNDSFTSVSLPLIMDDFNDEDFDVSTDTENDVLHISSSSSDSNGNSSDDESDTVHMNSHLLDQRPLYSSTSITVCQFSRDILEFCRISHVPDKQRTNLLDLFRQYLPSPNLVPKTGDDLLGSIGIEKLYQSEKMCGICYSSTAHGICSTVDCIHEKMKIPSDDIVEVISFDLTEQLKVLINQNIELLQTYQDQARTQTTFDVNDIVRGDVYQSILKVHKDLFISVMIHSDGVPLYKSKNFSAWPILGAVLELPPYSRTRADNILLLALWLGKKKPNFNVIFEKLSKQLTYLKNQGVETIANQKIKIFFPMLMGDMPALSAMVQFVEPNAYYACMFCKSKGIYNHDGHCVIYHVDNEAQLRTSENFRKCAQLADSMHKRIDRERTIGCKGLSAFSEILDVPLPHSVVIDAMHTVFLCHSKKLLIHLQTFITKENLLKINLKLRSMNFIHDVLRRPRSFANVHRWKASEVRTFILYIGVPILAEFLPEESIGDLALYNTILRLLHDHWQNDKKLSDSITSLIKIYIKNLSKNINSDLYPPKLLTISTHTHLHLPFQCRKFGRLDWLTNFIFESFLGFLKAFVKGSSGAGNQIAFAFISNFFLSKTQGNAKRRYGHFSINNETFGSNILKIEAGEPISSFLYKNGHVSSTTIFFSRLHYLNITYHSFMYSRKGSTCSYLVSYEKNGILFYGYILCFLLTNGNCSAVIQTLTRVNYSLTSSFLSYKYVTAIKDFIDNVYIAVKRVEPSLFIFDDVDVCAVTCLRSRCFCVPFGDESMILTSYSCAYEHN
ncbi:unnamed protein product [Adineta steineri]|uniref:Transposase domain-containing protein n=1 Tax=Adineta steineri TaxID=433720 RepID=A0A815THA8_9BILA|nr:unnamed protein product [Adineta steineri]CAF1495153.1 unnamed protein product [Adineta steineri]CAF1503031.1 unnamed protein product [Adineta steineri]